MDILTALIGTFSFRLAKFLLIFAIVFFCASQQRIHQKRLLSVTLVVTFIITGAIYDLIKFVDWEYYQYTFQGLSHQAIVIRYVFSLVWRAVILGIGIRLLFLDNQARKVIIVLAWVQILTVFWKHPVPVFQHLALQMQQHTMPGTTELIYPWLPWVAFLFFSIFDIIISSLIIYFFSRSLIKDNFMLK